MLEELKNLEIPKVEQTTSSENISESLDFSKNIENIPEKQKLDQLTEIQKIQATPVIVQTDFNESDKELANKIENILESDLKELYMNMPKEKQMEFKQKGEEITYKISILLKDVKVQVKKIVSLIVEWLGLIPQISKIFIKQEAKIKTDKIIALKNKK